MLKTSWRWTYRIAAAAALLAGLAFAGTVLSLRYWLLPNIGQYRNAIAASVSEAAGTPISIGSVSADWHGLRPHLSLGNVLVSDRQARPALALSQVDVTLAWWSLLLGEVRLDSLEIDSLNLNVRRDSAGRIFVAGIEVNRPESGGGFADWILRQHHILVRDAAISWQDERRGAPPLVMSHVGLRLENGWNRHRFGLRAVPPAALAAPVDLRGDVKGETLQDFAAWKGTLYINLERFDLAAWKPWLPLPLDLGGGSGGVRLWLGFDDKKLTEVTADLNLRGVRGRLGAEVPEGEFKSVTGRLGWRNLQPGFEFSSRSLGLVSQDGIVVPPADVLLRYLPAEGGKAAQGEFRANRLRLEPLVRLAAYFPLSAEQRGQLADLNPKGTFRDLQAKWSGDWRSPDSYAIKYAFNDLGLQAAGRRPGYSGLSGRLDATHQGGTLSLDSRGVKVEFPSIFAAPIPVDNLTAQASWKVRNQVLDLKLTNLSLANEDAAGTVYGSYRSAPDGPGVVDLTGQFSRAEGRRVERYLPLVVGQATRDWLKRAILAGRSGDARFRLKGNLAQFPFVDDKGGVFEVTAKVDGGVLEYAPGWPRIDNIAVDLRFHGARMDVLAHQGAMYGMKLSRVRAAIPDLLSFDEVVEVDGEAAGPTHDMLKFIANSPVNDMIDGFTQGMQAEGNGNLALKLRIPLRHNQDTQVSGGYEFINNRVVLEPGTPMVEQVNGKLAFSQDAVQLPRITGQLLGGSVTISGATQADGSVRVGAQGQVSAAGLRKAFDHPVMRHLNGQADWHGTITLRDKLADVVVDSNLVGLGSTLPYPFGKAPAAPVSLRLERKIADPRQDTVLFNYGRTLSAHLLRRRNGGAFQVERGAVTLGGAPILPAAGGLWLTGELGFLDLDQWRGVLGSRPGGAAPGFAGVNLKFGALDTFGRRFGNLRLNARAANGAWQANVQGKEITGDVNWRPAGPGKLVARLKYLTVPPAAPTKIGVPTEPLPEGELPTLDLVAEEFDLAEKKLGRLELQAAQQADDWRIEKLKLSTPDSTLQADGVWQTWRRQPRTRVNLHLDVRDLGKLLARAGFPDTVKQGEAKLDGQLSWAGSPQNLNFATLSGSMKLEARKGQFLRIEPGIGKLLGILSLQALPQRITLDFRDVFSDGFAFNDISASVRVKQGVAVSDDFSMAGPAALVSMTGETNLAAETQDLRVHVIPVVGDSVSAISALIGGPVVGLTAIIVQKVLKEPLGQMVAYDYRITGTWDNPKVEKLVRKAAPTTEE